MKQKFADYPLRSLWIGQVDVVGVRWVDGLVCMASVDTPGVETCFGCLVTMGLGANYKCIIFTDGETWWDACMVEEGVEELKYLSFQDLASIKIAIKAAIKHRQ